MRLRLGEILVRAGMIDEAQLLAALGEQKSWGHRLGVTLVKMGFVTEQELVKGLANQLNLPIAHLEGKRILPEVRALVPQEFADQHMCLPLFVKKTGNVETLFIAMDDPCDLQVLDDLSFRTGMRVKPVLVASSELCQGIDFCYRAHPSDARPLESAPPRLDIPFDGAESTVGAAAAPSPIEFGDVGGAESPSAPAAGAAILELADEHLAGGEVQFGAASDANDVKTRTILHTLTQLLIEKGVIDRAELAERLRRAGQE